MGLGIKPREFMYGMAVFSCVPTTLTSGVALVRSADGNAVLALLLTVGSNLIGVATVPFVVRIVLSSSSSINLSPVPLLLKLLVSVLAPLILGALARAYFKPLGTFASSHKTQLSMLSNFLLVLIVWQTVSRSAGELKSVAAADAGILLAWAVVLHSTYLVCNGAAATLLRLEAGEWIAVVLLTSQKTLPVTISVLSFLPESIVGEQGLLAIPPIIGHITQLIIDSVIVSVWAGRQAKRKHLASLLDSSMQEDRGYRGRETEKPAGGVAAAEGPSFFEDDDSVFVLHDGDIDVDEGIEMLPDAGLQKSTEEIIA